MKNSKANVENRQKAVIRLVTKGITDVSELAVQLHVTTATIRRDLNVLEERGVIKRHFGGASYMLPPDTDVTYSTPTGDPTPAKLAIARKAAELVQENDLIYINSSSTALKVLDYLGTKRCSIVTNNGRALYADCPENVELFLTGGEIYGNKQSLVGSIAVESLRLAVASRCIMGTSGISADGGVTSAVMQECYINRQMIDRCDGPIVVVADGSKIGVRQKFFSYDASKVTHLVTDTTADQTALDALRKLGIEVILVNP